MLKMLDHMRHARAYTSHQRNLDVLLEIIWLLCRNTTARTGEALRQMAQDPLLNSTLATGNPRWS